MVDFVRKATKKSLLAMLRKADKITSRLLARLFEGVLFKDEFENYVAGGGTDHGTLGGLSDDDHVRYLDKDGTRALTGNWDVGAFDIRAADLTADGGGVYTNTVSELTATAGVTIDGCLIKDGAIAGSSAELLEIGTATYDDVQDFVNQAWSSGVISGFGLTDAGSNTVAIAAGTGFICDADDANARNVRFFDYAGETTSAIADGTTRYIYVNYAGTPAHSLETDGDISNRDRIFIGWVTREGATLHITNAPQLASGIPFKVDHMLRETLGFKRADALGGLILGESGDTNRNISLSAGEVYYGLDEFDISAVNTAAADTFTRYYRVAGVWTKQTGLTQWPNTQYTDGSNLQTMTVNRYGCLWWYIDLEDGHLIMLYGTSNAASQTTAEAEAPPSAPPERVAKGAILVGRFVYRASATIPTLVQSSFRAAFNAAGVSDHGVLSGLSDNDHVQYILHSLATAANDFLVASGSGAFVKKTLAETGAILEADLDHGSIQGLSDDDHSQYLRTDGTRASTGQQTFNSGIKADTVDEKTADAGVTVDGVLIKDAAITGGSASGSDVTINSTTHATKGNIVLGTTETVKVPSEDLYVGSPSSLLQTTVDRGILSSVPVGSLVFAGEDTSASAANAGAFLVLYSNDGAAMASGDRLGGFGFGGSSSASALRNTAVVAAFTESAWVDASDYGTYLRFETTAPGGTSRTEKVRVQGDGSVGIGTTSPTALLDVAGDAVFGDQSGGDYAEFESDGTLVLHGAANIPSVNYAFVTANDVGTDVTAAELETLTDGSDTALHNHGSLYYTETESDAKYLPLTAGSAKPLTGNLYLDGAANPSIYLREGGSATSYAVIFDQTVNIAQFVKRCGSGTALIYFSPEVADGLSDAAFGFFRTTNTTGNRNCVFYLGNGTSTVQHLINSAGDVSFCTQNGNFQTGSGGGRTVIGTPASSGATLFNGSISFYLDEAGNNLKVEVKYSTGTTKTATIALV